VRYEPHLITADDRGQIRGIFRMNPKYDPSCQAIGDLKCKRKSVSPVQSPDKLSLSPDGRRSAVLLSKDEQTTLISQRKSRIERKF